MCVSVSLSLPFSLFIPPPPCSPPWRFSPWPNSGQAPLNCVKLGPDFWTSVFISALYSFSKTPAKCIQPDSPPPMSNHPLYLMEFHIRHQVSLRSAPSPWGLITRPAFSKSPDGYQDPFPLLSLSLLSVMFCPPTASWSSAINSHFPLLYLELSPFYTKVSFPPIAIVYFWIKSVFTSPLFISSSSPLTPKSNYFEFKVRRESKCKLHDLFNDVSPETKAKPGS